MSEIEKKERRAIETEAALRRLLSEANALGLFLHPAAPGGGRWHILNSKGEKIFPDGGGAVALDKAATYFDKAWDSLREDEWGH